MKAITLWQPWASMVAVGLKTYETRSWPTTYRGPLAIHAAKYVVPDSQLPKLLIAEAEAWMDLSLADFPRGVIVATAHLSICRRAENIPRDLRNHWGNFAQGRWAWLLSAVTAVDPPIPARGYQRLWNWDGTDWARIAATLQRRP